MMIRIQSLIARSTRALSSKVAVYIFDVTPGVDAQSQFLEAAKVITPATPLPSIQPSNWELKSKEGIPSRLKFLDDYHLANLCHKHCRALQHTIDVVNRNWRIGVVALDESFEPTLSFVILGGVIIFLACVLIGIWVRQNALRVAKLNELRAKAESEKAALAIEAEHRRVECELNDYMAHEIRNPIAAALSACTFVKSAVNEVTPLVDEESRNSVREDVAIVDNSLHFVNDLLRNMLDMHRASDNQLKVDLSQTDIMKHVFESVDAMLYRRGSKIKVILECPENLVVVSDHLRLKQITLNLGRNSAKFMSQGFIRLRAEVVEGNVRLSVSDSGCGISVKKRELLFQKFQESLDSLSQGTGIGLYLCKELVELLGGTIWLDESYNSGVPGYDGTRFVIDLNTPPVQFFSEAPLTHHDDPLNGKGPSTIATESEHELPEKLSVLFVDDDMVLRKLFARSVRKVAPGWIVREASSGEAALLLTDSESFDLIFMDQYMASVERQLLGTETVSVLRAKGVACRICGLSANDMEDEFIKVGAHAFMFKPFPCESNALINELHRILEE